MDDKNDDDTKIEPVATEPKPKWIPPMAGMGRQKGQVNKITKTLKSAIMESFDRIGGVEWLVKLAEDDPKTYAQLIGRVIPLQVKAEVDHTVAGVRFNINYEKRPETITTDALPYNPAPIIDAEIVEAAAAPQEPEEAGTGLLR